MTLRPRELAPLLVLLGVSVAPQAFAQRVVLGGNPQGSQLYPIANAIASLVSQHSSLRVDVLPQGASVFYPMMASEEVDFGLVNPMDAVSAVKGEPPYDRASRGRGFPLETLMLGSPILLSIVTARDAGIASVADLRGRRVVANYGAFASSGLTARAVLANAGLSEDDVEVVTVSSYPEGVRAVIEGRAVAATGSLGSGIIRELDAARGAKILPIDASEPAMGRVNAIGSAFVATRASPGTPGVEEPTWVLSYEIPIVVRESLSEDVAYAFVKAVWEHYAELESLYPPLATWTPDRFASTNALVPYHPGAIRLYREKGVWTAEMQAYQERLESQF